MEASDLCLMLGDLAERHHVPGAQLSVYHQGRTFDLTHGVERSGEGGRVSTESHFAFGSVAKIFTAALVMQLVEDGDCDLDAPLSGHLRGQIPERHPLAGATPRQLLSHTAGLPSDHEGEQLRSSSMRRYLNSVLRARMLDAPGTAFSYANTGYAVAAYLVEALTGQSWWDTMEDYLLRPAGLDVSFLRDARWPSARNPAVSGHAVEKRTGHAEPVDFYVESTMVAAGGLAGSARDLVRFARAFLAPQHADPDTGIADPAVLREMGTSVDAAAPFGLADGWGAGWGLFHSRETTWWGHDGTLDGGTCNVRLSPDGGSAVALTTNATTGLLLWEDLVTELDRRGLDVGHYRQPSVSPALVAPADELAGEYANGDLTVRIDHRPGGGLTFTASNGFTGDLTAGSDLTCTVEATGRDQVAFAGRFLRDPESRAISSLQYNGRTLRRVSHALLKAA
ncbi:CubicO group peptidase (beta-lactamase class C family) [Haloactinospora alba]|uniref:CubicO group peptidase (Beta-lactamase class C family) n=1 Tax=Haloactinospora alba TaxID=405555 RepID=A0A543N7K2_9ACTN|nr:serine hydrolase domain-containing protein [Haloactinospora alba]TQN27788.1 CubicO group peptidase (beta-lactamase class C family) [Haloactinospora alba]